MRKGLLRIIIFVLVSFTAISSQVPLVLCFGEDGHVRFEMASIDPTNQRHHYFLKPNAVPINELDNDEENCGNCLDLPFYNQRFITAQSSLSGLFIPYLCLTLPPKTWQLANKPTFLNENPCAPPCLISQANPTLENVVLII